MLSLDVQNGFCSEENIIAFYDYLINYEMNLAIVSKKENEFKEFIAYYKDIPNKALNGQVLTEKDKKRIPLQKKVSFFYALLFIECYL